MIDPAILRHDPERVRESMRMRGESPEIVDQLLAADSARRGAIGEFETKRARQKDLGREVSQASGDEKALLLATTKALAAEVKAANAASETAAAEFNELMKQLPNLVFPDVPIGGEEDFVVLESVGTPRDFAAEGFEPKDHLELGELLGAIDVERGVKVSGSRFYFLTGHGARLELALLNLAMAKIAEWGLTPMIPPSLVKPSAMEGTGFLGQAEKDVYHLPADDLYLVGTAEVAMAAYHSEEILEAASLPLRYAGYSPCFRREAGSYGKDTRGIFRVHWFDKVEMFVYCEPEQAEAEHRKLLEFEKEFIELLELPYQVLDVPSGDLGMSAARKYDCYAWIPTMGKYREITSTSNCTEFQSRRLNIRVRGKDGLHPVATLNGTLCAMPRIIIALLENHQQADGSVRLPVALRPFFGGDEFLRPTETSPR